MLHPCPWDWSDWSDWSPVGPYHSYHSCHSYHSHCIYIYIYHYYYYYHIYIYIYYIHIIHWFIVGVWLPLSEKTPLWTTYRHVQKTPCRWPRYMGIITMSYKTIMRLPRSQETRIFLMQGGWKGHERKGQQRHTKATTTGAPVRTSN